MPPLPSDYIHDRVSSNLQCSRHGHSFFIQGRNLRSTSQEVHTTQTLTANLLVAPTANLLVGGPPAFCILLSLSCCSRHPTPHFLWFQRMEYPWIITKLNLDPNWLSRKRAEIDKTNKISISIIDLCDLQLTMVDHETPAALPF